MHSWKKSTLVAGLVQSVLITHRLCICEFAYLKPPTRYLPCYVVIYEHAQNSDKFELCNTHTPSWELCFVSAVSLQISVLCTVYLMTCFSYFCVLFGWFCFLTWPLKMVLKCCLVFLSAKRLWRAFWKKKKNVRQACFRPYLWCCWPILVNFSESIVYESIVYVK